MSLILVGMQGVGKTRYGQVLADAMRCDFFDTDLWIEKTYAQRNGEQISYREIYQRLGDKPFRQWERRAVVAAACSEKTIIATGGGVLLDLINRSILRNCGAMIYLHEPQDDFLKRQSTVKPSMMNGEEPYLNWLAYYGHRHFFYSRYSTIQVTLTDSSFQKNMSALLKVAAID